MVKLLESMEKDSVPLGEGSDPTKEALRIQARVAEGFPNTDIYKLINPNTEEIPPLLITNFLGIAGAHGPLPAPYTQQVIERTSRRDTGFRDFLDIFNHRLISMLHRIRKKHWIGISNQPSENSLMGKCLKALLGIFNPHLENRLGIPDQSLTHYSGLLWQRPRSAFGLRQLLEGFFRMPVEIQELGGKWHFVPHSQLTSIGKNGQHNVLGESAIIGPRFWDQQALFTVKLGPMDLDQYVDFLKPGKSWRTICSIIRYYVGNDQDFMINLVLKKEQIPKPRLGYGVAIGWTNWLNRTTSYPYGDDNQCRLTTRSFRVSVGGNECKTYNL
jgi:type VI secretion system protein ImpH